MILKEIEDEEEIFEDDNDERRRIGIIIIEIKIFILSSFSFRYFIF